MLILGLESSCDETALALVRDGKDILASRISSQIHLHARYGGVVPELASRSHVEVLHPMLQDILAEAQLEGHELDTLAVTVGPGLQGALLVALTAAQTLSWLLNKPLVGVNHLEGHIYANFVAFGEAISFPLLVLLVSGGHTQLIAMRGHGQYELLADTRDDAVGEAFDKVARMLDLSYPGGPVIDQLARQGNAEAFALPRAMKDKSDFSFSGLKTAVLYTVRKLQQQQIPLPVADLCASFQAAAVEALVHKTMAYVSQGGFKGVAVTGGVSANSALRERLQLACEQQGIPCFIPPMSLCTDNAVMIAAAADYRLRYQPHGMPELKANPRLRLVPV